MLLHWIKAKEANNNRNFIRSQNSFSGLVLDKDNQPLEFMPRFKLPKAKNQFIPMQTVCLQYRS